jgi:tetratricopeptide (TPR) repeat protein
VATPPATPAPAPAPTPAPAIAPSPPPQISAAPSAAQPSLSISPSFNASNVTPEPVVTEGVSAPRRTITQRLNPINWFSGTPKEQAGASASASASQAEPPLVAPGTRYVYPPFVTPIPGDRAQAKGLQAEAIRARQAGDVAQSIRAFKAAIAADPTFYEAPLELGLTAIQIRDYTTALEELHRALSLQENSAEARYAFAWTLGRRGYTEDAVRELGELLSQHPNDVRGHLLLGSLYAVQLGQPKQAREQYTEALKLDPNNSQAGNVRAWLQQNP